MTTEAQSQYNSKNTVVTVNEDFFDRKQKELRRMRRTYCAMPQETAKYAYGSMTVLANESTGVAEYDGSEVLLGKKDTLDEELGGLLLKACVADLKKAGYNTLLIHGANAEDLTFCQQLKSEDAVTILEHDNSIAPLTLDQALQGTEHMDEELHTSREFASGSYLPEYFDVFLDLESINSDTWPSPVDQEPYLETVRAAS